MGAKATGIALGLGLALGLGIGLGFEASARASRPPEALETERREQEVALQYLIRKADSLSSQLVERRGHLRQRLRAMYKMSQGGYLRLLLGAGSPADLFARRDAADRILLRDTGELEAVRAELGELAGLREKLRAGARRAAELGVAAREVEPVGLARHDALRKPARGEIVRRFGPYRDAATGTELSSDGVLIATHPGDPVFAVAAGAVRSASDVPGLGEAVIIDHGEGWVTLVGRLSALRVRIGARVPAGFQVAEAAGQKVEFQISQGGAWLDPAPWLEHESGKPSK